MTDTRQGSAPEFRLALQREAIAEKVVKHVLELVREGVLTPGQKLPSERDLAGSMGVGRPSLREALRALALMGILEIRHGEGVFVSKLTPDNMLQPLKFFLSLDSQSLESLFEARVAIEASNAEVAAQKIDDKCLGELRECMAKGAAVENEPAAFKEVDVMFHRLIVKATKNPFLIRISESLQELGQASRDITVALPGVPHQSHADHAAILAALEHRSPKEAREAMTRHLRNVQAAFRLARLGR